MRIGIPVLLIAAVLALVAIGEEAHRDRTVADARQRPIAAAQQAPAADILLPDLAAMDRELKREIARMNAATGQAKLEAMAEVLNVMARQRGELRQALETMQEQMTAAAGGQGDP